MALKQVYVYEKIPPEFILLFREQKNDPYWCQRCPYAFFPTRPDAMRHGKQHCMKDERVVTCTGQKPITEEARKEKERRRKRAWMQTQSDAGSGVTGALEGPSSDVGAADTEADAPVAGGGRRRTGKQSWSEKGALSADRGTIMTAGFFALQPITSVMVATVTVDLKKGYAHSVCALLERGPPGIVLWADCDPMMASSCRVAFSWWRANLSYLCRTLGVDEPAAETRISVAICPRTTMVQTSASAAFALAIVAAATGRAVRRDVGVTGELDLMGNLHAVRGVRSKAEAMSSVGARIIVYSDTSKEVDLRGLEMEGRACRDVYEMMSCALDVHVPRPALSDVSSDLLRIGWANTAIYWLEDDPEGPMLHTQVKVRFKPGGFVAGQISRSVEVVTPTVGQIVSYDADTVVAYILSDEGREALDVWVGDALRRARARVALQGAQGLHVEVEISISPIRDQRRERRYFMLPLAVAVLSALSGREGRRDTVLMAQLDTTGRCVPQSSVGRVDVSMIDSLVEVKQLIVTKTCRDMLAAHIQRHGWPKTRSCFQEEQLTVLGVEDLVEAAQAALG